MIKDTLFICGNGLDLAHSLKTSYSDFQNYCYIYRHPFYENFSSTLKLNTNENSIDNLWAALEKSIGEISPEELITKSTEHERLASYVEYSHTKKGKKIIPHEESELTQIQASGYMRVLQQLEIELKEYLSNQIDFDKAGCINDISKILHSTSKVITFNYTETIENLYKIQKEDILHIHGNVHDNKIIIGHGNKEYYSPQTVVRKSDPPLNTVQNLHLLYLTKMFKNTKAIYQKHKDFFNNISGIKQIIIFGHSLAEVDDYYFKKIKEQFPKAKWKIYTHSDRDKKSAELFKDRLGFNKGELKLVSTNTPSVRNLLKSTILLLVEWIKNLFRKRRKTAVL